MHGSGRDYFLAAVMVYGLSAIYSVFLWRKGFRQHDRVNYGLLLLAAIFHTTAMFKRGFSFDRCPVNNLYEATLFLLWTIVATYLVVGLWPRLRFLGAFAAPLLFCVGVFALMPGLDNPYGARPEFKHDWVSLHAALILLSYGAFGLSSVAGLMYLTQDDDPKVHWSILVWLLYFALLIMNWRFAQGGRRFAWGAVGCFLFVLLTFWGVNLMSPIHH